MPSRMSKPRAARRTIALALAICLAGGLGLSWLVGPILIRGHASAVTRTASPAVDFFLTSEDGARVAATYRPGRTAAGPAVLLLHGVDGSRDQTAANVIWLNNQGYATLTIDFRGHGASTLTSRSFGLNEAMDAATAFHWLKRRQRNARVAIVGASLGGAASLLGASGPLPADALVLQAVYPDLRSAIHNRIESRLGYLPALALEPLLSFQSRARFGAWPSRLSPVRALPSYDGPVFIVGGAGDSATPPDEVRAMYDAATGPKRFLLIPGLDHAAATTGDDSVYRAQLLRFLRETIGGGRSEPTCRFAVHGGQRKDVRSRRLHRRPAQGRAPPPHRG